MANDVFANGREISCKKADGKSICAFPDVCFTPPQKAATPPGIPVPYPNTGMAKDTTKGSKRVKISGQEIILRNLSYFKTCYGDQAGCASKKGFVTTSKEGKVFFNAWSIDVKVEGKNVVRHFDPTTHNHASLPANTATWPYLDQQTMATSDPCFKDAMRVAFSCSGNQEEACKNKRCQKAKKCMLVPYTPVKGQAACCDDPKQTPHHLIEVHCFTEPGGRGSLAGLGEKFKDYREGKSPCVCCGRSHRASGDHGVLHAVQNMWERAHMNPDGPRSQMGGNGSWNYGAAKKGGLAGHKAAFGSPLR